MTTAATQSAPPTAEATAVQPAGRGRLDLLREIAQLKADNATLTAENGQLRTALEEAQKPQV